MTKKEAKALKKKLKSKVKKPLEVKKWLFKALPVVSFAVVAVTIVSLLLAFGANATHEFYVDLGGGGRVDEIFAVEPPQAPPLPPIQELPSYTPNICDPDCDCYLTYYPTYVPCDLKPIPVNLECLIPYVTIGAFFGRELKFTFNTDNRTAEISILKEGSTITASGVFEVIGTSQLLLNITLLENDFTFEIEVVVASILISCTEFLTATGFYNPFSPALVLFANWA